LLTTSPTLVRLLALRHVLHRQSLLLHLHRTTSLLVKNILMLLVIALSIVEMVNGNLLRGNINGI
jgi:hypothetical protein